MSLGRVSWAPRATAEWPARGSPDGAAWRATCAHGGSDGAGEHLAHGSRVDAADPELFRQPLRQAARRARPLQASGSPASLHLRAPESISSEAKTASVYRSKVSPTRRCDLLPVLHGCFDRRPAAGLGKRRSEPDAGATEGAVCPARPATIAPSSRRHTRDSIGGRSANAADLLAP